RPGPPAGGVGVGATALAARRRLVRPVRRRRAARSAPQPRRAPAAARAQAQQRCGSARRSAAAARAADVSLRRRRLRGPLGGDRARDMVQRPLALGPQGGLLGARLARLRGTSCRTERLRLARAARNARRLCGRGAAPARLRRLALRPRGRAAPAAGELTCDEDRPLRHRSRRAALAAARRDDASPPGPRRAAVVAAADDRVRVLRRAPAARRGVARPRRRLLRRCAPCRLRGGAGQEMSDASSRTSAPSRAARRRTIVEESWFGAFGATGDAPSLMDDSRFTVSWAHTDAEKARERSPRSARAVAETTFARIYGAFIAARAAIG